MTEIDTADERITIDISSSVDDVVRRAKLYLDEIDRLSAALAESERLKEKAAISYVGEIAERDRARAEALEEAAKLVKENNDWPLTGKKLKLAIAIRELKDTP